jgi:hypothetical protein
MQRYQRLLTIASLSCAACSSAEDPSKNRHLGPDLPPYQASLFFAIDPPDAGTGCPVTGAGYVANIGGPPRSSASDPGPRAIDGSDFARIRCAVSGNGTFNVNLSAQKSAASFTLENGTVSGGSGTGTISVAGPGTNSTQLTGNCRLDLGSRPLQSSPGTIGARFDCPAVNPVNQNGATCNARGEFVFENCDR